MYTGKTLLAQLMDFQPWTTFARLAVRYDLPGQVRSLPRTALLTGHARSNPVATLFSIHSRTLSPRLKNFGTSSQDLLDEGRFEIARQILEDTRRRWARSL